MEKVKLGVNYSELSGLSWLYFPLMFIKTETLQVFSLFYRAGFSTPFIKSLFTLDFSRICVSIAEKH